MIVGRIFNVHANAVIENIVGAIHIRANAIADDYIVAAVFDKDAVSVKAVNDKAAHRAVAAGDMESVRDKIVTGRREFNPSTRLRRSIQNDGLGNVRQRARHLNFWHTAARNIKIDNISVVVAVRRLNRRAQRANAVAVRCFACNVGGVRVGAVAVGIDNDGDAVGKGRGLGDGGNTRQQREGNDNQQ